MSSLSRPNKDEDEKGQIKKDNNNIINLSNINLNKSKDYYYKNKNKNFININEINDNNTFNQNNYHNKNNINNNNQINNFNNSFIINNNSNKYNNNFLVPTANNIIINDDIDKNNNKRIINQNCYQINIENMNIHNSINNISQNYNISTLNDNENSNKNNISIEYKKDSNTSNISKISYNSMNLNDLLNTIDKVSENQSGCRLLQNKLQQNSNRANDFYKALESKQILKKMTIDSFGNYLIQKLLEYITNDIIQEFFINIICPSFMEISLNPHGSRVIQKLLGRIYNTSNLMKKFNECLQSSMLEIFLNQSSTHIIIKYISLIKYPNNQIIYTFIVENIYYIATHKHSCCTLQKCLEEGNNIQRKEILMSLANISSQLFADQYGNYAIQFALSLRDEEANKIIISQYLYNFQKNISNKISSNVYEKVLEYCDFNTKQFIIKSLCNFETVKNLLYDTYGNYVLQKTLLASTEPYRSMYIKYIAPLIDGLKNLPNGLIIIHKIISHFPELQNYVQINSNKNRNYNIYNNNNMNNNMNINMTNSMNNNINNNMKSSLNNNMKNNLNNNMNNNMNNLNNLNNNMNNNFNINNNYIPFKGVENTMMYNNNFYNFSEMNNQYNNRSDNHKNNNYY